ncbi:hypothetical protein NBRC116494_21300 [Aurantivibrio plasticivorans]
MVRKVAIFYCQNINISRSKGRSATAASAYRAAIKIIDERTGATHDFERKKGVLDRFMFNHSGLSRSELWNLAETSEPAKNARVAREWQLALPQELGRDSHRKIIGEFAEFLVRKYGSAIDVCVHAPGRKGDHRNIHAHLLMTTRAMKENGVLSKNKIQMNWKDERLRQNGLPTGKQQIEMVRKKWADIVNSELAACGLEERISHLSLKAQGITDKIPQLHVGPIDTQLARMGYIQNAQRWAINESIKHLNNIISLGENHSDVRRLKMKNEAEKLSQSKQLVRTHCGLASSHEDAEKAEAEMSKTPIQLELDDYWKPVRIDPNKGRVIDMFKPDIEGIYRWGAGHKKGEEAFRDKGIAIYSKTMSEWALAAELELAQAKVAAGDWKEIRAFGDEEYRRRIWAQGQMMGIEVKGYKPTEGDLKKLTDQLPKAGLATDQQTAKAFEKNNETLKQEDKAKFESGNHFGKSKSAPSGQDNRPASGPKI